MKIIKMKEYNCRLGPRDISMALVADSSSGITTYNLSAGKTAPEWMKERMSGKSLRYNEGTSTYFLSNPWCHSTVLFRIPKAH